jgi:hypothetical protein
MSTPAIGPHDDYVDRLNAEVERRLAYMQFDRARCIARSDASAMLNNTLERAPTCDSRTRSMTDLFRERIAAVVIGLGKMHESRPKRPMECSHTGLRSLG